MRRRACSGGPHDGVDATARGGLAVGWIDGRGHVHAGPGRGRFAYRRDGDVWRFAGHGTRRCDCGGTLAPHPDTGDALDECPLCGAPR